MKAITDRITFLSHSFKKEEYEDALIGVSGGVDSAVSLTLAVRALGRTHVYPVLMPYGALNDESSSDALSVIKWLGIPKKNIHIVDIQPMVDAAVAAMDKNMDDGRKGNVMARMRMVVLYDLSKKMTAVYLLVLFAFIGLYLHNYYVHYPWDSERWWHAGWCDAVGEVKKVDESYEKIIISMADEPAWIFFAGCYQYDPFIWQKEFPLGNDVEVKGFGKISHTDKFYFGKPEGGIYSLKDNLDEKSLYLASAKEIPWNLIMEPTRVPDGLNLVKAIPFPSGEPAFYLLTKK